MSKLVTTVYTCTLQVYRPLTAILQCDQRFINRLWPDLHKVAGVVRPGITQFNSHKKRPAPSLCDTPATHRDRVLEGGGKESLMIIKYCISGQCWSDTYPDLWNGYHAAHTVQPAASIRLWGRKHIPVTQSQLRFALISLPALLSVGFPLDAREAIVVRQPLRSALYPSIPDNFRGRGRG